MGYPLMLYKGGEHDSEDPDYRIVNDAAEETTAGEDGYSRAGETPAAKPKTKRTRTRKTRRS